MTRIDIDFGTKRRSGAQVAGILMFAVAIAALAVQAWTYFELRREAASWQADRHRLDRQTLAPRAQEAPAERERLLAELRLANRIIDRLDTPWDALFGAIETTAGEQAILLGVEPDAGRREVRLTVEAKDAAAMLDYLRALRREPALKNAHLTGHQINMQDMQRPLRFTIDARWAEPPPVREETAAVPTVEAKP